MIEYGCDNKNGILHTCVFFAGFPQYRSLALIYFAAENDEGFGHTTATTTWLKKTPTMSMTMSKTCVLLHYHRGGKPR
jgi:hypothetical protein